MFLVFKKFLGSRKYLFFTPVLLFFLGKVLAMPVVAIPCEGVFSNQSQVTKQVTKTLASQATTRPRTKKQVVGPFEIPRTKEEEILKAKGIRADYALGVDSANYMLKLGKKLREYNIDPARTHIEDFASAVPLHIEFARQSLEAQNVELSQRLQILNNFKKEAETRIKNQAVTYQWWLAWNFRLTVLLTTNTQRESLYKDNNLIKWLLSTEFDISKFMNFRSKCFVIKLISQFPEKVALPTVADLGIIAMNRVFNVDNIFPLGIVGTAQEEIDGRWMSPAEFFYHDIAHISLVATLFGENPFPPVFPRPFHDWLIKKAYDLPVHQQELLEYIYFMVIHERIANLNDFTTKNNRNSLLTATQSRILREQKDLLPKKVADELMYFVTTNQAPPYFVDSMQLLVALFQQWLKNHKPKSALQGS